MATLAHWRGEFKNALLRNPSLREALSSEVIERHCRNAGHRWRASFWCPSRTILVFLLQVLDGAKTLRAAVATLLTQLASQDCAPLPSPDPTAYCQARLRLPGQVILRLLLDTTARMRGLVTKGNSALRRRVWVVDGSSASMPDTPTLQEAFPQPVGQAQGCGFPVAQFVALFCWTTGAIVEVVIDTIVPHELQLFRRLWHHFQPGDVVLGDRAYSGYVDLARLLGRGVFAVCRLHQRRPADFRAGRKLGPDDRLTSWARPKRWLPSFGVSEEEFQGLPETLIVRLIRIPQTPRGFRSQTLVIVTTLLDPIEAPADEIRTLYRDRWTAELNLRSLKTHLGMDVLRSQSPDMVRKEIAMFLLAYNLIRLLMWQAAQQYRRDLHRLSFTGTLHRLRATLPMLITLGARPGHSKTLWLFLLQCIAADQVPYRPNRIEPRRRKRRPKNYSLLTKPRDWYRQHGDLHAR